MSMVQVYVVSGHLGPQVVEPREILFIKDYICPQM